MVKREYSASDTDEEQDELLLKNSAAQRPGSGLEPKKKGRPAQTTGQETKPSIHNLPEEEVEHQFVVSTSDSRPGSPKKARVSKNLSKGNGEKAASKSVCKHSSQFVLVPAVQKVLIVKRWIAEEDAIVIGMMEKLIKEGIWQMVKTDGRLVSRTSYGVQYHALMLVSLSPSANSLRTIYRIFELVLLQGKADEIRS
jgi:hypothetical protein